MGFLDSLRPLQFIFTSQSAILLYLIFYIILIQSLQTFPIAVTLPHFFVNKKRLRNESFCNNPGKIPYFQVVK